MSQRVQSSYRRFWLKGGNLYFHWPCWPWSLQSRKSQ